MAAAILKKVRSSLVVIIVILLCALGAIAASHQWVELSAMLYYLIAIISIPPAITTVFPQTIDHVHRTVRAVLAVTAVAVLVFVATFTWSFAHRPVYKIAVSLPFATDTHVALAMYDAIHDHFEVEHATFINNSQTRMVLHGKVVELVPFSDSKIGDTDCTVRHACEITLYDNQTKGEHLSPANFKHKAYFSDIVADPQVVAIVGPYNSGVALRELPAINKAHIPLISPANTADCLTDPAAARRDCDVKALGEGSYFRTVTPDSLRQKVLADYVWDHWRDCPNATCANTSEAPRVVVFRESGPQASTFSEGAAEAFIAAWTQHSSVQPAAYPVADSSTDGNLRSTIERLTVKPNIVVYAGTGKLGGRLYDAFAAAGYRNTLFAGPGSIRDTYMGNVANPNPLFNADFAAVDPTADAPVRYNSIYAACAYDAAGMLLQALFAAQKETLGVSNYRTASSVDQATSLLPFNATGVFRDTLIHKLRWINTTDNISYHGITGTYSFNGGDTSGATGVTISHYVPGQYGVSGVWRPVNDPVDQVDQ